MFQKILIIIVGLIIGIGIGYIVVLRPIEFSFSSNQSFNFVSPTALPDKQVIGFLPYWLLNKAQDDYSDTVTTVAYFAISPDTDGSIKKLNTPIEEEPGWYSLHSGRVDPFLDTAKKKKQRLSLVVFSGDPEIIDQIITKPEEHAQNLVKDVLPLMSKYDFSDLNLDIERVNEASSAARDNFTRFVAEVKNQLVKANAGTLTVDITGSDLIRHNMSNPEALGKIADFVVLMTYDYHYVGSMVTGSVAPIKGAGTIAEYDVESAVEKALEVIPSEKIIVGVPLYGYEWETIGNTARSATLPSSGITASNQRVEEFLAKCSSCTAEFDTLSQEEYLIYKDQATQTYHQLFYPNSQATQAKIDFVTEQDLGGLALWALGYEGRTILDPLKMFIR